MSASTVHKNSRIEHYSHLLDEFETSDKEKFQELIQSLENKSPSKLTTPADFEKDFIDTKSNNSPKIYTHKDNQYCERVIEFFLPPWPCGKSSSLLEFLEKIQMLGNIKEKQNILCVHAIFFDVVDYILRCHCVFQFFKDNFLSWLTKQDVPKNQDFSTINICRRSFSETRFMLREVLLGLRNLHSMNNPLGSLDFSDILLCTDSFVTLDSFPAVGFDIAQKCRSYSDSKTVSPEIAKAMESNTEIHEDLLKRSDIYCFGFLLFKLFLGNLKCLTLLEAKHAGELQHKAKTRIEELFDTTDPKYNLTPIPDEILEDLIQIIIDTFSERRTCRSVDDLLNCRFFCIKIENTMNLSKSAETDIELLHFLSKRMTLDDADDSKKRMNKYKLVTLLLGLNNENKLSIQRINPDNYTIERQSKTTTILLPNSSVTPRFAIKRFSFKLDKNEKLSFINEISHMLRLNHQNIIKIHKVFLNYDENGVFWCNVVLPFYEFTFRQWLLSDKDALKPPKFRRSLLEALNALVSVSDALIYIHSKDLLHGDLKEENILVNSNNQVSVIDMGELKDLKNLVADDIRCSSGYAPKEYRNFSKVSSLETVIECVTCKVDIFSFGRILYNCCVEHSYGLEVAAEELEKVTNNKISTFIAENYDQNSILKSNGTFLDGLKVLIVDCLSQNKHQRPDATILKEKLVSLIDLLGNEKSGCKVTEEREPGEMTTRHPL